MTDFAPGFHDRGGRICELCVLWEGEGHFICIGCFWAWLKPHADYNKLVGGVLIVQERGEEGPCDQSLYTSFYGKCHYEKRATSDYTTSAADSNKMNVTYSPTWKGIDTVVKMMAGLRCTWYRLLPVLFCGDDSRPSV